MRLLERLVCNHPIAILLVFAAITAALLPGLAGFKIDISAENFIPDTDAERYHYRQFLEEFGRDDFLIALFPVDDAFSDESLAFLKRLGATLGELEQVATTFSLSDAVAIELGGLLPVAVPLVKSLPLDEAQRERLRSQVLGHSLYGRKVVSPDGKTLVVSIAFKREIGRDEALRNEAVDAVQAVLVRETAGRRFELTGIPLLKTEVSRYSTRDAVLLGPTAALAGLLFLWLAFRRFWAVVVSAAAAFTALAWTMSLFFLSGQTLDMATTLVPTLVIAISLAQIIFVVAQYQRAGGAPNERMSLTLRRAVPPCFLAALTTAAGFASLTVTTVAPVREFGLAAALGITFAFMNAVLLVPALIRLRPDAIPPLGDSGAPRWNRLLAKLTRRQGWIALFTAAAVAFSAAGIFLVRIETSAYEFFSEDDPLNRARLMLQSEFDAASSFDIMAERKDGRPVDGKMLAELLRVRDRLALNPVMTDSLSLLDVAELLAGGPANLRGYLEGGSAGAVGASVRSVVAGNVLLSRYLSPDGRKARMTVVLKEHSAERILAMLDHLEAVAPRAAPHLDLVPTGQTVLFARMVDDLFLSQITSVTLILLFVTVVFIIAFGSLKIGLISLLPNITPIVITLGLMGWLGIPLNVLTIMVAGIAIGIAVDDTIHLMQHVRLRLAEWRAYDDAIDDALVAKGRPIVITSLLLTTSLLALLISGFRPTIFMGALTAMTMLAAMVGDLVLLPALLRMIRPKV